MINIGLWIGRPLTYTPGVLTGAVRNRVLAAVKARILEITFPDVTHPDGGAASLSSDSVVVKKLALERIYKRLDVPVSLPCIIITPQRSTAVPTAGTLSYDDYVRPVLVTIVMADNAEPTLQLNLDIISLWQEKIERAFHNQRLAGVPEVLIGAAEPAETVVPNAWSQNVLVSAVLLKFTCREPRGLT